VIAEYHGGTVRAMNLADGSGVAVLVQLPLASAESAQSKSGEVALRALPN
jgi:hypothetical protein